MTETQEPKKDPFENIVDTGGGHRFVLKRAQHDGIEGLDAECVRCHAKLFILAADEQTWMSREDTDVCGAIDHRIAVHPTTTLAKEGPADAMQHRVGVSGRTPYREVSLACTCGWKTICRPEEADNVAAEHRKSEQENPFTDAVNHPSHYNSHPSGVECITIVEAFNFNIGNAVKYLWRAGLKGDAVEDLRKAAFYCNREAERIEKARQR